MPTASPAPRCAHGCATCTLTSPCPWCAEATAHLAAAGRAAAELEADEFGDIAKRIRAVLEAPHGRATYRLLRDCLDALEIAARMDETLDSLEEREKRWPVRS